MSTLTLQLVGAMQSYGLDAAHTTRRSWAHPTKSAVVGMLAAALGRKRTDDVSDLARLALHVRIDQPGQRETDFHTVKGIRRANGKIDDRANLVKHDEYLSDAAFLVVLEGDAEPLRAIHAALHDPAFFVYLGRKAHVPCAPLLHGPVTDEDAITRLSTTPLLRGAPGPRTVILEDPGGLDLTPDQPVSLLERTMRATRRTTFLCPQGA